MEVYHVCQWGKLLTKIIHFFYYETQGIISKLIILNVRGSLCLIGTRQKVRETILKSTQNQPPMDLYTPTEVCHSTTLHAQSKKFPIAQVHTL